MKRLKYLALLLPLLNRLRLQCHSLACRLDMVRGFGGAITLKSKTIAYWIAEYVPVGKKIWGAHQGIELAEWIFGLFLAIAVFLS